MTEKSVNAKLWLRVFYCVVLLLGLFSQIASSEPQGIDPEQNELKLKQLRKDIDGLRQDLDKANKNKNDIQQQLRYTEKSISKLNSLTQSLSDKINRQKSKIKKLEKDKAQLLNDVANNKSALSAQIRTNYIMGQQAYIKLLLNQQKPQALARTLAYYDYYHKARVNKIETLNAKVEQINALSTRISETTSSLEKNQAEKLREIKSLHLHRKQRTQLVAKLNRDIDKKGLKLNRLIEDEQQLKELVKQIQQDFAFDTVDNKPFAELKGQLLWPAKGKLVARFGSRRKIGSLKWHGVMISTQSGSQVRAISRGRVAYADWLRGFGLLMILDHGNGYMSLYGHNDTLFKEPGNWVEANEVITAVGASGGNQQSGLYFEIRHNGKPVNPTKWCKKMPPA